MMTRLPCKIEFAPMPEMTLAQSILSRMQARRSVRFRAAGINHILFTDFVIARAVS